LILNEKDEIRESRKKTSDEIIAAAKALDINCDNIKQSLSKKRARDGLDDEYSDISNKEQDDIYKDNLDNTLSNAVNIPYSLLATSSLSVLALQSPSSISLQLTKSLLRSYTYKPA
jgi:hypothetical protein